MEEIVSAMLARLHAEKVARKPPKAVPALK
jgi:hypothetical protein